MQENPYKPPQERAPLVPKKRPFIEQLEDALLKFGVRASANFVGIATGCALAMSADLLFRLPEGDAGFYVLLCFLVGAVAGGIVGWFLSRMVIRAIFRVINPNRDRSGSRQRA